MSDLQDSEQAENGNDSINGTSLLSTQPDNSHNITPTHEEFDILIKEEIKKHFFEAERLVKEKEGKVIQVVIPHHPLQGAAPPLK